jgi:6-phospho-beta-glucosidase
MPEGKVNPKGIAFYNNLINELVKYNIEPIVTIYHFDLPLYLAKQGG